MRAMLFTRAFFFVALTACGGTTIIDPAGSGGTNGGGGDGGTSATTSTSTVTTGTGAGGGAPLDCDTLTADVDIALSAATECNACIDGPDPCEYLSGQKLTDLCGCPLPVNATQMDAVAKALELYGLWVDMGCGPFDCGQPCAVSNDPTCQSAAGCDGACAP